MRLVIKNDDTYKNYEMAVKEMSSNPADAQKNLLKVLNYINPKLANINKNNSSNLRGIYSNIILGIGIAYYNMNKSDIAVKFYKESLKNNKRYINNGGYSAILNNMTAYMNASTDAKIPLYVKSCKMDPNNIHAHVNLRNIYNKRAKSKTDENRYKYLKQSIYVNIIKSKHNKSNKITYNIKIVKYIIDILTNFKSSLKEQEKWLVTHINNNISPLVYNPKTKKNNFDCFNNKADVINLFKLVEYSLKFLGNHLATSSKYRLYQYTGINTLKSICNLNKSDGNKLTFHLRLYNSDYMNDPLEGKGLLAQLIYNKNVKKSKNVRRLINYIYHHDDANMRNNRKKLTALHANYVYLASLSYVNPGDNDSMSLWNSYSDNHKGISLGLDVKCNYDKKDSDSNDTITKINNIDNNSSHINEIPLNLYKISYDIDDFNDPEALKRLKFDKKFYKEHINDSDVVNHHDFYKKMREKLHDVSVRIDDIEDFNALFKIISNINFNVLKNSHVFKLIKLSLDRIRFLSKSGVYRYESEYRIMKEIPPHIYKNVHYDSGNEKLYVNLGNNGSNKVEDTITANLTQIVFGNRCKSYYWVPIVEKQLPGVQTLKSDIKYR